MDKWSLGAASKDQIVGYDKEINVIYATYSYNQDILDEMLNTKQWWKQLYWGLQTN